MQLEAQTQRIVEMMTRTCPQHQNDRLLIGVTCMWLKRIRTWKEVASVDTVQSFPHLCSKAGAQTRNRPTEGEAWPLGGSTPCCHRVKIPPVILPGHLRPFLGSTLGRAEGNGQVFKGCWKCLSWDDLSLPRSCLLPGAHVHWLVKEEILKPIYFSPTQDAPKRALLALGVPRGLA